MALWPRRDAWDMTAPQSLIEQFSERKDPRVEKNKKHELIDVIVLCVCAVVSGAEGWSDIEEFGLAKLKWLRRYVPLANGVPVDDTIARIISALSVSGFQECFMSWMEDAVKLSGGEIIAVDGKTQRRSHDRKRGLKALHMVSAWASRNGGATRFPCVGRDPCRHAVVAQISAAMSPRPIIASE